MKYLKKFEDNNTNTLKKYIIIQFIDSGNYFILRTLSNSNENIIRYDKYYEYNENDNEIMGQVSVSIYKNYNDVFNILYQTDDEQDAIDALKIMIESSKYNL